MNNGLPLWVRIMEEKLPILRSDRLKVSSLSYDDKNIIMSVAKQFHVDEEHMRPEQIALRVKSILRAHKQLQRDNV